MPYEISRSRVRYTGHPERFSQDDVFTYLADAERELRSRAARQHAEAAQSLNANLTAIDSILASQTILTHPESPTMPSTPRTAPIPSPVEMSVTPQVNSEGATDKFVVSFTMDMGRFAGMISPKLMEETFASQSKVYLTAAIGKMLQEESFQEMLKPKIREHLIQMPLDEIMSLTGRDVSGIIELLS